MSEQDPQQTSDGYPTPKYAWTLVAFLTLAYISSFIDRYILGLLIDPIKADTGATDFQMGLLSSAFTWVYALAALPLGFMVDRRARTKLVAIGIFLWSLATIWTGVAKSFFQLFLARMSVGVGEAILSPAAFSMIGDSFPKERRGLPIAVYSMALVIGAAVANLLSGGILKWAATIGEVSLPFVGQIATWQFIFIVVGLPGFILAAVFLFLREPPRIESSPREGASLGDAFVWIGHNWAAFFTFVPIFMCMVAIAYGQFFNAPHVLSDLGVGSFQLCADQWAFDLGDQPSDLYFCGTIFRPEGRSRGCNRPVETRYSGPLHYDPNSRDCAHDACWLDGVCGVLRHDSRYWVG